MKVGVLGSGEVGKTLAAGFLKHGHEVMVGTRAPERFESWAYQNPRAYTGFYTETSDFAEIVVLAVKGSAAMDVLRLADIRNLHGKIVIDATNPIDDVSPTLGVLRFFTDINHSLMEDLQKEFEGIRFVKAFNSVGAGCMVNPQFRGGPPTMFICGNDQAAKEVVSGILAQFGWEAADMGKAEAARAIEPLSMLWFIPGFLRNDWTHAFKLLG